MFNLGLVGAGRMGRTHLRALEGSAAVRIAAVCEPVASLRHEAVSAYGVIGHHTLDDMLETGDLDGVLVVTPSDSHVEVIDRVARAGLPILCEKPCGVRASDAIRAQQIVDECGVKLQIAYWRRFVPQLLDLRDRVVAVEFGEVLSISCLQWDGAPPAAQFRARSGGVFVDMGVHEFDQARWLSGGDLLTFAVASSPVMTDTGGVDDPDSAQVLCTTSVGTTVLVSLGRHYAGGDMASVEVFGTRDHALSVFLDPADGERVQLEALRDQAAAFAEFANGGACRGASVEDAVAALDAAERCGRTRLAGE